ncbi:hypothetical protein [Massilibacterium senegalense]|uniref:hypothetical protein n=1 Tax=Massilibacterium senegalense TaxID=1632858 RepID=UPI0007827F85|nr:hypothetical protein [Massilibacterium senegalense]
MKLNKAMSSFFYTLAILVLSILYAGLVLSAIFSVLAGILRTFGFEQIKMGIWYGVELPIALSIPLSVLVSFFLLFCSHYVKRFITFFVSKLKC